MGRASHIPLSGLRVGVAGWRVTGLGLVARGYFSAHWTMNVRGERGGCGLFVGSCLFISGRSAAGFFWAAVLLGGNQGNG